MIRLHIREERTRNGGGRRGGWGRRRGGRRLRGGSSSGGSDGDLGGGRGSGLCSGGRLPAAIQGSHSGSRVQLTPTIVFIPPVSYTHLRAHETDSYLVCRLLLEKKKNKHAHN